MGNIVKGNPFYIDEEGIISTIPLVIQKIILKQAAAGDAATFTYWREEDDPITNGDKTNATATVTASTGTFASTGNFPAANVDPNQIIRVFHSVSGYNIGRWQIATNADDNTITVRKPTYVYPVAPTLTNDTNGIYKWKIWAPYNLITIKGSGVTGDTGLVSIDFGPNGFWVPNLAMHTLSANAVLYVYLKNR